MNVKEIVKHTIGKLDYQVTKLENNPLNSTEPFVGIKSIMSATDQTGVFFDVGANVGQTIVEFRSFFPAAKIYSFEPGRAYSELKRKFGLQENLVLENIAFGSKNETKTFHENDRWDMSSFLQLGKKGWGQIVKETEVSIKTIDSYCRENQIRKINLLKCDTQGFELEVLRGSSEMLEHVQFVFLEVNFTEVYKGLPSFFDIFDYLTSRGMELVKFYRQQFEGYKLRHADVLFYNPSFHSGVRN
jgi:FkbM family methyltransferase